MVVYDLQQVTKDYGLERVSGPLTYNEITSAAPEGRRHIWTDRETDWEEADALDTGQERPDVLYCHWLCQGKGAGHGAGQGYIVVASSVISPHGLSCYLAFLLRLSSVWLDLNGCMLVE